MKSTIFFNKRSVLVSELESVEAKLGNMERRFTKLEEKYVDMGKDKESKVRQVEEVHFLFLAQKEKENELQSKFKALEAINKLRRNQRPMNHRPMTSICHLLLLLMRVGTCWSNSRW